MDKVRKVKGAWERLRDDTAPALFDLTLYAYPSTK